MYSTRRVSSCYSFLIQPCVLSQQPTHFLERVDARDNKALETFIWSRLTRTNHNTNSRDFPRFSLALLPPPSFVRATSYDMFYERLGAEIGSQGPDADRHNLLWYQSPFSGSNQSGRLLICTLTDQAKTITHNVGLGKRRSLKDYLEFSGVDLYNRKLTDRCKMWGRMEWVPYNYSLPFHPSGPECTTHPSQCCTQYARGKARAEAMIAKTESELRDMVMDGHNLPKKKFDKLLTKIRQCPPPFAHSFFLYKFCLSAQPQLHLLSAALFQSSHRQPRTLTEKKTQDKNWWDKVRDPIVGEFATGSTSIT